MTIAYILSRISALIPRGPGYYAHSPDYSNTKDYLYIPTIHSAKKSPKERLWHTIGLTAAVVLGPPTALALFYSIDPFVILVTILVWLNAVLIAFKLYVMARSSDEAFTRVSRSEIHAVSDRELPRYTIFVPLLNEAPVMRQIIRALTAIDYPSDKLEILCTFEEYDLETIFAFRASNPPSHFKEIILPNCNPKSKPKALNIALREATGEFFVIYDAEIIPDPHQLKHAYLAFKKRPDIAVFQTRLEHYNASENALTRLFNMEFASYYDMFLPGLQNLGLPIPFSGHSVHMRASAVRKIGGWDPYNVAEDCDLGIRLFRHGFMAGMIDSISNEEAVSGIWDWIKQRTRWMKGFIQSSVVHLRHPRQFIGEIGGIRNAVAFILLVPGTVFFNLMNFFSWALLLTWLVFHPPFIKTLYPGAILGIAVTTFVAGTVMFVYQSLIAAYRRKNYSFVKYGLLTPLYWMLLSFATMRAVQQFITSPHSWEKTRHGAVHTSSPLRIFLRGLRKELSFKV